jgi:hypothetical protein
MKATSKVLRAILIAVVLVVALVSGGSLDKSGHVSAMTCWDAWNNYYIGNFTYETARYSYFYNQPTSCDYDCRNYTGSGFIDCVDECRISRGTTMASAELAMFNLALDTCTPMSYDECAEARAVYDACLIQYDPSQYPTWEERLAVSSQLMACREASKIDTCQ